MKKNELRRHLGTVTSGWILSGASCTGRTWTTALGWLPLGSIRECSSPSLLWAVTGCG